MAPGAETIASLQAVIGADTTGFQSALSNVANQLGGLGGILSGLSFGGLFGDVVGAASADQDAFVKLSQTVKDYNQQTETVTLATGHFADVTESLGPKAQKASDEVALLTAKISDQESSMAKSKGSHQAMQVTIEQEREKIAKLTSEYNLHTGTQRVFIHDTEQQTIAAQLNADQLAKLADAYSKTTDFSKDTVENSEAVLATFHQIGASTFPQATQAILDTAQVMGGDLQNATVQVGKALNDPLKGISALQRIGVTFSDTEKEQIKQFMAVNDVAGAQGVIIGELNSEFGGAAVAAGQTFSGQLDILQHSLTDVAVSIGDQILPFLQQMVGGITDVINWIQSADPGFLTFAGTVVIVGLALGAIPAVLGLIGAAIGVLTSPIGLIVGAVLALKLAFDTNFLGIRDTVNNIIGQIKPAIQGIADFITHIGDVFNNQFTESTQKTRVNMKGGMQTDEGGDEGDVGHVISRTVTTKDTRDFGERLGAIISEAAPKVLAAIQAVIQGAWNWLTTDGVKLLGSAVNTLMDWGQSILAKVPDLVASVSQFIGNAFDFILKEGPVILGGAIRALFDFGLKIGEAIPGFVKDVTNFVRSAVGWIVDEAPRIFETAITNMLDFGKTILAAMPGFLKNVQDFINGAIDWVKDTAITLFSDAIGDMLGIDPAKVKTDIEHSLQPIKEALFGKGSFLQNAIDAGKTVVQDLINKFDDIKAGIAKAFQGLVDLITQPFKDALVFIGKVLEEASKAGGVFAGLYSLGASLIAAGTSSLGPNSANANEGSSGHGHTVVNPAGVGETGGASAQSAAIRGGVASRGSSAASVNLNGAVLHFHGVQDVQSLYTELQKLTGYKNSDNLGPAWS